MALGLNRATKNEKKNSIRAFEFTPAVVEFRDGDEREHGKADLERSVRFDLRRIGASLRGAAAGVEAGRRPASETTPSPAAGGVV